MLALPPDLADSAADPEACWARSSWLTISPGKTWSPINLNPFCGDIYGPSEVDFTVFVDQDEGLFLEVVTNAPATIPFVLYRIDGDRLVLTGEYGMPGC